MVTVATETVQTDIVAEAKLTARPGDAVALTMNGAAPIVWFASAPNTIACVARTVKL